MLNVKDLRKTFQSGDQKIHAIKSVTFIVDDGEFASIIGKSGSGKSTLLSLLGALDRPSEGSIEVGDKEISKLKDSDLIKYRCSTIGFIFQSYNLIPNLTALENVLLPMEFAKTSKKEQLERARELLKQVGLTETEQNRKPGRLSGGQQQRVAIARALANRPKLILADEPTGNLDSQTGKMIFDLLHSLAKSENTTILVVTHDLDIAGKTDKTFELSDGVLKEINKRSKK